VRAALAGPHSHGSVSSDTESTGFGEPSHRYHCIDDGAYLGSFNTNGTGNFTNPYNLAWDKAVCSHDLTHVFKINGLWAPAFQR